MHHFRVLENLKVGKAGATAGGERAISPLPGTRSGKKDDRPIEPETNISNEWRIYAKMEGNYHLTNKYALFFNMTKYYKSIGRDPFDVLPLSYHIKKGTSDMTFFKFMQSFKEFEEKAEREEKHQKDQSGLDKRVSNNVFC